MSTVVKCGKCGHKFPDNPEKHQNRAKLCPQCLTPYTHTPIRWLPNLNWIKEKLFNRHKRETEKWLNFLRKINKSLTMSLGRPPSEMEIRWAILDSLTKKQQEKFNRWENKMRGEKPKPRGHR